MSLAPNVLFNLPPFHPPPVPRYAQADHAVTGQANRAVTRKVHRAATRQANRTAGLTQTHGPQPYRK